MSHSLTKQFLITMPNLQDNAFEYSAILMCKDNSKGIMGFGHA
ncbi:hypothetical protein [Cysteiniphilum sp. QT6929]|nr:hypothetical protein [Cysteiniphilum sp. QT6929]WHN65314.1 hypothetical protein NYP54_09735 [Cysteiniphilum sp. QT6929]